MTTTAEPTRSTPTIKVRGVGRQQEPDVALVRVTGVQVGIRNGDHWKVLFRVERADGTQFMQEVVGDMWLRVIDGDRPQADRVTLLMRPHDEAASAQPAPEPASAPATVPQARPRRADRSRRVA